MKKPYVSTKYVYKNLCLKYLWNHQICYAWQPNDKQHDIEKKTDGKENSSHQDLHDMRRVLEKQCVHETIYFNQIYANHRRKTRSWIVPSSQHDHTNTVHGGRRLKCWWDGGWVYWYVIASYDNCDNREKSQRRHVDWPILDAYLFSWGDVLREVRRLN